MRTGKEDVTDIASTKLIIKKSLFVQISNIACGTPHKQHEHKKYSIFGFGTTFSSSNIQKTTHHLMAS